MRKNTRTVIVSDIHCPHQDEAALSAVIEHTKCYDPAYIFFNGDICDFYATSRYDKSPARRESLQDELDATAEVLARFRRAAPHARFVFLEGNHEDRLRRLLWSDARALSSLRSLQMRELLQLDKLDFVACLTYGEQYEHFGTIIEHGNTVRSKAGYTAHGMLDKRLKSGISGHTHRLSMVTRVAHGADLYWIEGGCLCSLNPEYAHGVPDWAHGFVKGEVVDGQFWARPMRIKNGAVLP